MTTGKGSALDLAKRNAKAKSHGNATRSGVSRGTSPVATSRERRDFKEPPAPPTLAARARGAFGN